MNKTHSKSNPRQKRKARNRSMSKRWKRSKLPAAPIFQPSQFDTSDDSSDATTPSKPETCTYDFEKVISLTPSKSEADTSTILSDAESAEVVVSNHESDLSFAWSESRFDVSSDEDVSYSYSSIFEELCVEKGSTNSEVVSARINEIIPLVTTVKTEKVHTKSVAVLTIVKKKPEAPTFSSLSQYVQCFYENDGILVVLEPNQTVYFNGFCILTVLRGKVEILGHTLSKNSPAAKVYSPRGSSLLYITNTTESGVPITDYLPAFKALQNIKFSKKCAIVLCKKLHDSSVDFIEKHISQQIFPKDQPNFPRVVFQPKEGSWNLLKVDKKWNKIIDRVDEGAKMMICGGHGVGKTTFLRYAINRLLMKFPEVMVIDLDPGQSEFTVPGCISIVRVTEPVFGVNYTHLRPTERSIVSHINIGYDPQKYVASVQELLRTHLPDIPTLVNYMGYTHGLGIHILSAVITLVQPTDILQIISEDYKKNYKYLLKPAVVDHNSKLLVDTSTEVSYKLHQISSQSDGNDSWIAQSRQLREMCILSYISRMVEGNSLFQPKAPIYRIKLAEIRICDLNGEKLNPVAINAGMVVLARVENEDGHIFQCLGWGIVRGVDLVDAFLVLQTAENLEILDKTTHLVSHGGILPPSLLMTPEEVDGAVPYVMDGILTSFGQIPKRSRHSGNSKE